MAGSQRMMKSSIHLFKRNPIINRPIYVRLEKGSNGRSLYSNDCEVSNVKTTFNLDTSAMVNHLKADGIPPHKAEAITKSMVEYLAEFDILSEVVVGSVVQDKFNKLRKSMTPDNIEEHPEVKKWKYATRCGTQIAVVAGLTYYFTSK